MNLKCTWTDKMNFTAETGNHQIAMDTKAPIGSDSAPTPKQLLLAAICGCTAMDVVALLKKYKQPLEAFHIEANAELTEGKYPAIFKEVILTFNFTGEILPEKALEAVKLSQTKFCGVSAMVSKAVQISYVVMLNEKNIGAGKADFQL